MSYINRRAFVKQGSSALALAVLTDKGSNRYLNAQEISGDAHEISSNSQSILNEGLNAARQAGAQYTDMMYRVTRSEDWNFTASSVTSPKSAIVVGAGIRALYNGYWGFAGSDEVINAQLSRRLGTEAAEQARSGSYGTRRRIDLAPTSVVGNGHWTMPVEIDPFSVSDGEKIDFISTVIDYINRERVGGSVLYVQPSFTRTESAFASTEGSFFTQTTYCTECPISVQTERHFISGEQGGARADFATPAGAGWEYLLRAPFQDKAFQLMEHAARSRHGKPVDVGRYDVVFDAYSMAAILDATIAPATELDRVFGYESNNTGTSFINKPLDMLGSYRIGSPLINVSSNRTIKGGAATVKWDDEGVVPKEAQLLKEGVLADFQTTRESANWIASYYRHLGQPVQSGGCAWRQKGSAPPTHCPPNFILHPGNENTTFEDLIADTKRGIAVVGGRVSSDSQALNGSGQGLLYEIRDGKLGEVILGASYIYRTPEFWKNVVALGGSNSIGSFGFYRGRESGISQESPAHTISSVPAKVTGIAIVDTLRKA